MVKGSRHKRGRVLKCGDRREGIAICEKKLQESSATIKVLERLSGRGPALVNHAVTILTALQTTHEARVYQSFLCDILRHGGPGFVVLCAASLGKQRVVHLSEKERTTIVGYVKDDQAGLYHPALDVLATTYKVPSADGLLKLSILIDKG